MGQEVGMQMGPAKGLVGLETEDPHTEALEEPLDVEEIINLCQFDVEQTWEEGF